MAVNGGAHRAAPAPPALPAAPRTRASAGTGTHPHAPRGAARRVGPAGRDDGSVALEAAIITPMVIGVILLVIAAGRISHAGQAVDDAARAAARSASLSRTQAEADDAAHAAAADALNGVGCSPNITTDLSGLNAPLGTPGQVTVTVNCTFDVLPYMPAGKTVSASFTSIVDSYRERPGA